MRKISMFVAALVLIGIGAWSLTTNLPHCECLLMTQSGH